MANRTHRDNDEIAGILESGTYHFLLREDGCFLEVKCRDADLSPPESSKASGKKTAPANSERAKSYNLEQLQKLRSRVRWAISSNTSVTKSTTAQTLGSFPSTSLSLCLILLPVCDDVLELLVSIFLVSFDCLVRFSRRLFGQILSSNVLLNFGPKDELCLFLDCRVDGLGQHGRRSY